MIENNPTLVKVSYQVASDAQIRYIKGLFWRFIQIRFGNRFDPNSWELKSQNYWNRYLSQHSDFLVNINIDELDGCSSLHRLDTQSVSKIINHLKPVVDANPDFVYRKAQFVSRFSSQFYNQLKIA